MGQKVTGSEGEQSHQIGILAEIWFMKIQSAKMQSKNTSGKDNSNAKALWQERSQSAQGTEGRSTLQA